jgi:hypothetical protein
MAGIPVWGFPTQSRAQTGKQVFTEGVCYCCPILAKVVECGQILVKLSNVKFREYSIGGS